MKFCENTNYFARYMKKRQQQIKATISNNNTKTQSTDKKKQNIQRQTTDNISGIPFPVYNQFKKKQMQKKLIPTPIDLMIPRKTNHYSKPSFEEFQNDIDALQYTSKHQVHEKEDMTVKHINLLENKIMSIINIIDDFEKENNLNQDQEHLKSSFIFQEENAKTDRISNKFSMIEYLSPPNSGRMHRTNRNPSISAQESTNYYTKRNLNYNSMNGNNINQKRRVISNSLLPMNYNYKNTYTKTHYKSFSMKKMTQASSRFIDLKQATFRSTRNHSNNKSTNKQMQNQNHDTSKKIKVYPNQLKPKQQYQQAQLSSSKGGKQRNNISKNICFGNSIKDSTITPIDKNDFIDEDMSINLVIEDNRTNRSNVQVSKKGMITLPIKNFLKIKEKGRTGLLGQTKCQSDRNKRITKVI